MPVIIARYFSALDFSRVFSSCKILKSIRVWYSSCFSKNMAAICAGVNPARKNGIKILPFLMVKSFQSLPASLDKSPSM